MSKFIRHDSCPDCGSENNLAIYDDHEHCFSEGCGRHIQYKKGFTRELSDNEDKLSNLTPLPLQSMPAFKPRKLDSSTINKFKVTVVTNPDSQIECIFPRFDEDGNHVMNQVRLKDKLFRVEGDIKRARLFGRGVFKAGGRAITITEGYYDTLAAFQMTGSRFPHAGVMSASTAKREIADNLDWLSTFDKVVICFDSDEQGQRAAKECAHLFEPGKVSILTLEKAKDASDYLTNGWAKEYIDEYHRAPVFMPDGLKLGTELWDDIINHKTPYSFPYPWDGLNEKTYGIRLSEFTLILADTGVGKTSVCKEVEAKLLKSEELKALGYGVGLLHLEEPKYDTAIGLMSIHANKPYHLPDTEKSEEELREAYNEVVNTDRLVIYDHFGSNDIDIILAKIRHMAALGCKYIFVDHLSIIVSDQHGDERKQLDEISTKLKTLTMNLNISVIAVIHINRQGQVRGSAGPEQVANIIIRLERDKKDPNEWRRNVTKVTVEKNRFCGKTGPACYLYYNEITNRLEELDKEAAEEYERGGTPAGNEFASYGF